MDTAQKVVNEIAARFKLSDADIARQVSSSQPTIWRLRSGKTLDCSATLYRGLCQLYRRLEDSQNLGAGETAATLPQSEVV